MSMQLEVTGVETIELSDPKGLCNKPVPQAGRGVIPVVPGLATTPWHQGPVTPLNPPPVSPGPIPGHTWPHTPYTGGPIPDHTRIWTRGVQRNVPHTPDPDHNEKWGLGLPSPTNLKADKWEKNWQAKMSSDEQKAAFDEGYTAITQ